MILLVKKALPAPVKQVLRVLKYRTYDHWKKRRLAQKMAAKHHDLLSDLKGKERIKVVFLAIHKSVWKVDPVFRKMLEDPFFDPLILVCPYVMYGEERMWQDMKEAYDYFQEKGYPLLSAYNEEEGRWLELSEIKPDIVFFTNPHNLTRKEYYEDAYLNYLSCYVPYYSDIASDYNVYGAYDQYFHNAVWKQFVGSSYSKERAYRVASNRGENILVVGSPALEELLSSDIKADGVWKVQDKKKLRIIYAPHQSIFKNEIPNMSTFLEVAEPILSLAKKYKDRIQWSFKPHPLLRSKLYKHPDWGKEKTDDYYRFWESNSYTQLDEGEYVQIFRQSDAIIHDCGSFVLEYLLMRKPCAYLEVNSVNQLKSINSFGMKALECYVRIKKVEDIDCFLSRLVNGSLEINKNHISFLDEHIDPLYEKRSPSKTILNLIRGELT